MRLGALLVQHTGSTPTALRTLLAWLAGNAFLGAQFSWILRPFFGSPSLEVAFLREDPMRGSFHEAVFRSSKRILSEVDVGLFEILARIAIVLLIVLIIFIARNRSSSLNPKLP